MPPKLNVNDYTFYLVPDMHGAYEFQGTVGNVYRAPKSEFEKFPEYVRSGVLQLWGISNVFHVRTKKPTLVMDIFGDFS